MRAAGNMTLGEAKEVVHRNLPVEQQEASERLWVALTDSVRRLADED